MAWANGPGRDDPVCSIFSTTSVGAIVGGAFRTLRQCSGRCGADDRVVRADCCPDGGTVARESVGSPRIHRAVDPRKVAVALNQRPCAMRLLSAMRAALTGDVSKAEDARERAAQALAKAQGTPIEQARKTSCTIRAAVSSGRRPSQATGSCGRGCDSFGHCSRRVGWGVCTAVPGAVAGWIGGRMGTLDPAELAEEFKTTTFGNVDARRARPRCGFFRPLSRSEWEPRVC